MALATAATVAALAGGAAILGAGTTAGALAVSQSGILDGPQLPENTIPDPTVDAGEEGIRKGEMDRIRRRRALGQAFLTQGQERDVGASLGGMAQTLG